MYEEFKTIDLSGKTVAFFGVGDQESYYDTFVDGLGILYETAKKNGANIVGDAWSSEGYDFGESKALNNDGFVGLVIDDDNQSDETNQRVKMWVKTIKSNFESK